MQPALGDEHDAGTKAAEQRIALGDPLEPGEECDDEHDRDRQLAQRFDEIGPLVEPEAARYQRHRQDATHDRDQRPAGIADDHDLGGGNRLLGNADFSQRRAGACENLGCHPTEPSICNSIRRLHSTAYSIGSVFVTGSMKPLTTMPIACSWERPRLIR